MRRAGSVERLQVDSRERRCFGRRGGSAALGDRQAPTDGLEGALRDTDELRGELDRALGRGEARARHRHADLFAARGVAQAKALEQPPYEERDLGALRSAIEVRLVEDEEERAVAVLVQPRACRVEDVTLHGAQEHVLEH